MVKTTKRSEVVVTKAAKSAIKKASEVDLQKDLAGSNKCLGARKQYDIYIKKLWNHLEYLGDYDPNKPFPLEGLSDEALAKFVVALAEATEFSPSAKKSCSAAISCLQQENRQPNQFLHKELYLNLHLAYAKWEAYTRDHPREKLKAVDFSVEQGNQMLLLPIEGYRTLLDKAVLVLAWNCAQRVEDIYLYESKNIKKIKLDPSIKPCSRK
jgi:hypothetical protein